MLSVTESTAAYAREVVIHLARHDRSYRPFDLTGSVAGFASLTLHAAAPPSHVGAAFRSGDTRVQLALLTGFVLLLLAGALVLHWRAYGQIQRRMRALYDSMSRSVSSGFAETLIIPSASSSFRLPGLLQWFIEPACQIGLVERAAENMQSAIQQCKRQMREREARNILWLSFLCHDLCAPLVRVRTRIEALQSSTTTSVEEQRDVLESARVEIMQIREMIGSVSDFAQTDREVDRNYELTNLRQLLEYTLTVFEFDAGRRNIELDLRVLPGVGEVRIHRVLVRRALENLISNALSFTPEGGLVSLHAKGCGEMVEIRVSDTGPGIPPEEMGHIFDYRFRGEIKENSERPGSLGLGLCLVQKVADLHDGDVSVRNLEPHGVEFIISLPLAGPADDSR